jgi:hypothetical protein
VIEQIASPENLYGYRETFRELPPPRRVPPEADHSQLRETVFAQVRQWRKSGYKSGPLWIFLKNGVKNRQFCN